MLWITGSLKKLNFRKEDMNMKFTIKKMIMNQHSELAVCLQLCMNFKTPDQSDIHNRLIFI